jgi:hypothetical protein
VGHTRWHGADLVAPAGPSQEQRGRIVPVASPLDNGGANRTMSRAGLGAVTSGNIATPLDMPFLRSRSTGQRAARRNCHASTGAMIRIAAGGRGSRGKGPDALTAVRWLLGRGATIAG